jgi:NADPH2:quinone reductase
MIPTVMRAAWCEELGEVSGVAVREISTPVPGPGQALVRVHAAALNYPDVLIVGGRYQVRVEAPFVPGGEFCGEVVVAADGGPPEGSRVTGLVPSGAFAEYVCADAETLQPLFDGLDWVHGAALGVTYRTAYHSLVTIGAAQAGQVVAVLGAAGGVGLAAVDLGGRLGLRIIACASSADKVELCRAHGATDVIDYSREPLKQRLKELAPSGIDVVVDPVGGDLAEDALRALGWGGRFVTVGYASGTIPRIPLNVVLLKGAVVRGFEMRGLAAHLPDAIDACTSTLARLVGEGMRPFIGARYTLDDVRAAFECVAQRRALGKIVLVVD